MKHALIFCLLLTALAVAQSQQPLSATEDISGMFTFLKDGEFIQLNLEDGHLTGFVSRYGETASDKDTFLDHMFKTAELNGDSIHFITKNVHGIWYEFTGKVQLGEEKDPAKEGHRLLKGKLTQYSDDDPKKTSGKSREVTFKSFPIDALVNH